MNFRLLPIAASFATLSLACYGLVLFGDRQFGYRDAAAYYYPLHQYVQSEWRAGRWPLWEPAENAGMPLLGNPSAAVLYPGKLIFAIMPYAWGARIYIVVHSALAFASMLVLMRSWAISWAGSATSALAYAFGTPILFQYSNVIYLVGAAWLPLGIRAVDRWVRLGWRSGLIELAIVLAMQTLGGDPQSAYILCWAAGAYAAGMAWSRARQARRIAPETSNTRPDAASLTGPAESLMSPFAPRKDVLSRSESRQSACLTAQSSLGVHSGRWLALASTGLILWVTATLAVAIWLVQVPRRGHEARALLSMDHVRLGVAAAWCAAIAGFALYWSRRGWRYALGITWLGLASSAALAIMLSAAQLLPVIEFFGQTVRAAVGPRDVYRFSIEPYRLVELCWPNVMGFQLSGNTHWRDALKLVGGAEVWVPWIYLGVIPLMLALGALTLRRGPPWRVWLAALVVASLLGSLGQYTSPIWMARALAMTARWSWTRELLARVGPLDPVDIPSRLDGFLRDGDGSFYWWMMVVLPGFGQFRYPAKLFTFTALGLSALAGAGWDDLRAGRGRKILMMFTLFLVLSLAVLLGVWLARSTILASFRAATIASNFGPFDAEGGFRALAGSLMHASIVLLLGRVIVGMVRIRPRLAGACALLLVAADLAAANARCVFTIPQSLLDSKPEPLRKIEEHERGRESAGPFRIHRMAAWSPRVWQTTASADRAVDFVAWERATLKPKHGINLGVEYTHTFGAGEISEHAWFFASSRRVVRNPEILEALGVEPGTQIVYYPRRAFDIWNTRYFVVPYDPRGWGDQARGYASFLFQSERIYPAPEPGSGPEGAGLLKDWMTNRDVQILRNLNEFPRAWVVHQARWIDTPRGRTGGGDVGVLREILYAGDPLWHDATMRAFDPRAVAWVDRNNHAELAPYLSGRPPGRTERVQVAYPSPQRAVLDAVLESPGLAILADLYYPGWELTIDGKPAQIYRVNAAMRGAAVTAGTHRLVYAFAPGSFLAGRVLSIAGLGVLALSGIACALRPIDPVLHGASCTGNHDRLIMSKCPASASPCSGSV
jgi:hypothetical protein